MENKINIAELLKDCPQDMELDCMMYEDVFFDYVDELNIIHCYIKNERFKTSITFNQHGTPNSDIKSKCVIFPKNKTTWEGFVPPIEFKDGNILYIRATFDWVCIYKEDKDTKNIYKYAAINVSSDSTNIVYDKVSLCCKKDILKMRLASKKEKQKLFQAIKANGYYWNAETKTLMKLPMFKVGDRIKHKDTGIYCTLGEYSEGISAYRTNIGLSLTYKDLEHWELFSAPDKFDISTLKPFESRVLVRDIDRESWLPAIFGFFEETRENYNTVGGSFWKQCIPFENNESLVNTTKDCDDFYKTWK